MSKAMKSTYSSLTSLAHRAFAFITLLMFATYFVHAEVAPRGSVAMKVVNNAGAPLTLSWVNVFEPVDPVTGQHPLVSQTQKPIRNSTDISINSYNTHSFVVQFLQPVEGVAGAQFTKGPDEETVTVSFDGTTLTATQMTKRDEVMIKARNATDVCGKLRKNGLHGAFEQCLSGGLVHDVVKMEEEKAQIVKYRNLMSLRLRNYTCDDDTMVTTPPLDTRQVRAPARGTGM